MAAKLDLPGISRFDPDVEHFYWAKTKNIARTRGYVTAGVAEMFKSCAEDHLEPLVHTLSTRRLLVSVLD